MVFKFLGHFLFSASVQMDTHSADLSSYTNPSKTLAMDLTKDTVLLYLKFTELQCYGIFFFFLSIPFSPYFVLTLRTDLATAKDARPVFRTAAQTDVLPGELLVT